MSNVAKPKSDLSRAFSEDGARKTHVGGQALLEGVMMRGKYNWAVGVREPDGGVYEESHDLASGRAKNGWMYWPCVRGCRAMVESLVLGYKALEIAALHAFNEDEEDEADSASTQRAKATGFDRMAAKAAACEPSGAEGAMVGVGAASLHPLAAMPMPVRLRTRTLAILTAKRPCSGLPTQRSPGRTTSAAPTP